MFSKLYKNLHNFYKTLHNFSQYSTNSTKLYKTVQYIQNSTQLYTTLHNFTQLLPTNKHNTLLQTFTQISTNLHIMQHFTSLYNIIQNKKLSQKENDKQNATL